MSAVLIKQKQKTIKTSDRHILLEAVISGKIMNGHEANVIMKNDSKSPCSYWGY